MKKKITITTGTRADYGLLKEIINLVNSSKKLELYLLVTGMHLSKKYGYTINEIKNDSFKIYKKFSMIPKKDDLFHTSFELGLGITKFSKIFHEIQPDINLILGDRDEMLASALSASHMNILNAHIHGGDKTRAGIDEYNRHAITKLSNIHFTATKKSKDRVIKMGEDPKYVIFTGSPGIDQIKQRQITSKINLEKKYNLCIKNGFFLLVFHPVTTQIHLAKKQIKIILDSLTKFQYPIVTIMPNSDAGNTEIYSTLKIYSKKFSFIYNFKNVPRNDFLGLIQNSSLLIGNSSAGIIEASYFPVPVINLGIRQAGREHTHNVINIEKIESKKIIMSIKSIIESKNKKLTSNQLYGNGTASKKIIRFLENIKINENLISKQITY
jgi:GDP/UDP-N,N'-diacetylbacillosamine 2-epimerase (hydrolysing)